MRDAVERWDELRIETARFVLRSLHSGDASERYLSWLHDNDVTRTLFVDGPRQTIDSVRAYVASHDCVTGILFGIFTKDGLHIGTHSFRHFPEDRRGRVGVMIGDKAYWGKAVPLETRAAVLDFAFAQLGCLKMEAGCVAINRPAIYNFKKQGWELEGVLKRHKLIDGMPVDLLMFGITPERWNEARKRA